MLHGQSTQCSRCYLLRKSQPDQDAQVHSTDISQHEMRQCESLYLLLRLRGCIYLVQDDLTRTKPLFPFPALPNAATTLNVDITFGPNASDVNLWYMNGVSFRANFDNPVLLLAAAGNTSYPNNPQWNVYNTGSNSSVRLIIRNYFPALHPMHLHGHNFFVLAEGVGEWDGKITNYPATQRRDVQMIQPGIFGGAPAYLVLQYDTDNPGVWPFHCHIAWHVSAGLYINLMEHPDQIRKKTVPQTLAQTCRDWSEYSGHVVVDQIDSGL